MNDRAAQNRLSAEWAAYGDALGFMTELADTGRVQYRIGAEQVQDTISWRRKVGGYNGVNFDLPAGTYSDDTQLRLSTSRAIRSDGTFDVAAFAKVELPAWANYALGAGVGSKEAASNLARTSATWYSNFFDTKRASYVRGGGNGAAMRVQPHVWAARDLGNDRAILLDVVRNTVCTHGHPRGILGACLHALTLIFAMVENRPARMKDILKIVSQLGSLPEIIKADGDLRLLWLGSWEEASRVSFEKSVVEVTKEMTHDVEALMPLENEKLTAVYANAVEAIGALEPMSRGSGTKTALLAAFACSTADRSDPKAAMIKLTNELGSDTDTIATMAGAILGACTDQECDSVIQDLVYIRSEAKRLAAIADGRRTKSFRYPDLRGWKPARAAVDAIGLVDGRLWLNGIGELEPIEISTMKEIGDDTIGWCRLEFGQTIVARMRLSPHALSPRRVTLDHPQVSEEKRSASPPERLRDLFGQNGRSNPDPNVGASSVEGLTLSETLQRVISSGFSPDLIGHALLQQVDGGEADFVERGIALAANVLTAYEARSGRRRKK